MWQNRLGHCAVLTKVSEEFAPYYLAEIRHDMRQTTVVAAVRVGLSGNALALSTVRSGELQGG